MKNKYIEIKNLVRIYQPSSKVKVDALRGLNIDIQAGEMISIVGSSGSGKSTLLNILGGLDWEYSGDIIVDGKNIREYDQNYYRRYIVGTIFQTFYLIPTLTVEENILLPIKFGKKMSKKEIDMRLEELLEAVGLKDRRKHIPKELSGGQAQRVAIARALIDKPKIVLADEPTGNLDSKTGAQILELLNKLNKEEKTTMIVVTHDMKIADKTERKIKLVDGKNV
ncbi:MAG: ABC-type antimicrobial peptide transport system, ATPase component [candidate division WS6 bacterium 34_10]|uniref:ABC-type antimicrobial peptide transport system, ATPase component n=1 Tax=candidate division WS6 bacterium 34_10 TaxID=1641389 RepID=A0A101HI33_9BACT|nr:MAG: ABC-type antimicrobial peptide transport system, ATPase component [candidate division WS6 bacterium 34_10]